MDFLDELLAESMAAAKEKSENLKKLKLLNSPRTAPGVRSELLKWKEKITWKDEAIVMLIKRQSCSCGNVSSTFETLLKRQSHTTVSRSRRWKAVASSEDLRQDLPREVAFQDTETTICPNCAGNSGFDLTDGVTFLRMPQNAQTEEQHQSDTETGLYSRRFTG